MDVVSILEFLFELGMKFLTIPIPIAEYRIPLYAFFMFTIVVGLLFALIGSFLGGSENE